jgi:predicted RNA methylase
VCREDVSIALLNLLDNANLFPPGFFKGKSVLDVTTGTGVIGIGLSFLGCQKCTICCSRKFRRLCDENIKKNSTLLKIEIIEKELFGLLCIFIFKKEKN